MTLRARSGSARRSPSPAHAASAVRHHGRGVRLVRSHRRLPLEHRPRRGDVSPRTAAAAALSPGGDVRLVDPLSDPDDVDGERDGAPSRGPTSGDVGLSVYTVAVCNPESLCPTRAMDAGPGETTFSSATKSAAMASARSSRRSSSSNASSSGLSGKYTVGVRPTARAPREAECHADVAADSNGDSVAVTAVTGDVDASFVGERFVEPEPSSLSDISRRSTKRRADVNADASSRRRFDEAAPLEGVVSAPPAEPHSSAEDPVDPADSGAREASALVSDSDDPQSERARRAARLGRARDSALVSDSDDPQSECGLSESRPPRFRRRANGVAMRLKNRRGGVGPGVGLTDVGPGVGLTDVAGVTSALVRSASALGADFGAGAGVRRISVSSFTSTNARSLALAMGPVPATLRHAPKDNRARARARAAASSSKRGARTSAISSRSTSASFAPRPLHLRTRR